MIRRRDLIKGLGGVAASPLAARLQQPDKPHDTGASPAAEALEITG
jgi:hypothetical protein